MTTIRNRYYSTIGDVMSAVGMGLTAGDSLPKADRVFKSTRLEDVIYSELRDGDADMDFLKSECTPKLRTFPELARDVFQSFYSLGLRRNDETALTDTAKHVNSHILDKMMNGDDYATLKAVCEGRRLPAYDALSEFMERIAENLDSFLESANGGKGKDMLDVLEKLEEQKESLRRDLDALLGKRPENGKPNVADTPDASGASGVSDAPNISATTQELEAAVVKAANTLAAKSQQIEAVRKIIAENILKNGAAIGAIIADASAAAVEKAEETALAVAAWGTGGDDTTREQMEINKAAIARVRRSEKLMEITKYLGRFKEMAAKARKNGYAYGRGEKYTLEYGNDLSRVISSEFAALAIQETMPIFLRKYLNRRLLQYKRREQITKGNGDIIVCLDESGSTRDDAAWGKALALTLLDATVRDGRKFALIHFSHAGKFQTDIFRKGQYTPDDVFTAAETFLGGGTDFETPLREALRLIEREDFTNADIVFVTDGVCELPDGFCEELRQSKAAHGFTVTGILLDAGSPGMEFSLTPFCEKVYRVSELTREGIADAVVAKRV
jgi:uncharacterized protein with von Willebrand factor type A (vWA) domain